MNIQINKLIDKASKELKHIAQRPKLEAEILLAHSLSQQRVWLHMHYFDMINPSNFFKLLELRKNHIPIEYILGKVNFYSEEFFIEDGILIPRPETEILIDKADEMISQNGYKKIVEIGVGSGIISIILAIKHKDIEITATDINEKAIILAKKNAKKFDVLDRITFVHTEYMQECNDDFDFLISNPPYIANSFKLEQHLECEPKNALFGGVVGDEIIKNIIDISIEKKIKSIAIEMGFDQKSSLVEYLEQKKVKSYEFYKDLSGFDRGFVAKL